MNTEHFKKADNFVLKRKSKKKGGNEPFGSYLCWASELLPI